MAVPTTIDILGLPVAVSLDGSEYAPLVQGAGLNAVTRRAQVGLMANFPTQAAQAAGKFLAGPASGSASPANFRTMVPADLPTTNSGTFTCAAAASTTTVANTLVDAASLIFLQATNAAAATLMGAATSLYISARNVGVSFVVATANGGNTAGTETFNYWILG